MLNTVMSIALLVSPVGLDLPPEGINIPATAEAPAVRLDPPDVVVTPATTVEPRTPSGDSSTSNGRCVGWEAKLAYYSPGWSVERMSRIMYRESRCQPDAHNSAGANGLLQVLASNCGYLARQMGESCTATKLRQPDFNIRAARELFEYDGYGPWAL